MIFTDIHRTPQGDPQVRPISRRSGTKYLFCGWSWGWIKYSSISFDYIASYYIKWPIVIINFITWLLETCFQDEIGQVLRYDLWTHDKQMEYKDVNWASLQNQLPQLLPLLGLADHPALQRGRQVVRLVRHLFCHRETTRRLQVCDSIARI